MAGKIEHTPSTGGIGIVTVKGLTKHSKPKPKAAKRPNVVYLTVGFAEEQDTIDETVPKCGILSRSVTKPMKTGVGWHISILSLTMVFVLGLAYK